LQGHRCHHRTPCPRSTGEVGMLLHIVSSSRCSNNHGCAVVQ
jgi:hypothetical protein